MNCICSSERQDPKTREEEREKESEDIQEDIQVMINGYTSLHARLLGALPFAVIVRHMGQLVAW
jgi:hypothetical protein